MYFWLQNTLIDRLIKKLSACHGYLVDTIWYHWSKLSELLGIGKKISSPSRCTSVITIKCFEFVIPKLICSTLNLMKNVRFKNNINDIEQRAISWVFYLSIYKVNLIKKLYVSMVTLFSLLSGLKSYLLGDSSLNLLVHIFLNNRCDNY